MTTTRTTNSAQNRSLDLSWGPSWPAFRAASTRASREAQKWGDVETLSSIPRSSTPILGPEWARPWSARLYAAGVPPQAGCERACWPGSRPWASRRSAGGGGGGSGTTALGPVRLAFLKKCTDQDGGEDEDYKDYRNHKSDKLTQAQALGKSPREIRSRYSRRVSDMGSTHGNPRPLSWA